MNMAAITGQSGYAGAVAVVPQRQLTFYLKRVDGLRISVNLDCGSSNPTIRQIFEQLQLKNIDFKGEQMNGTNHQIVFGGKTYDDLDTPLSNECVRDVINSPGLHLLARNFLPSETQELLSKQAFNPLALNLRMEELRAIRVSAEHLIFDLRGKTKINKTLEEAVDQRRKMSELCAKLLQLQQNVNDRGGTREEKDIAMRLVEVFSRLTESLEAALVPIRTFRVIIKNEDGRFFPAVLIHLIFQYSAHKIPFDPFKPTPIIRAPKISSEILGILSHPKGKALTSTTTTPTTTTTTARPTPPTSTTVVAKATPAAPPAAVSTAATAPAKAAPKKGKTLYEEMLEAQLNLLRNPHKRGFYS